MEDNSYIKVDSLENLYLTVNDSKKSFSKKNNLDCKKEINTNLLKIINIISKVISLIAGLCFIVILLLIIVGVKHIGKLEIGNFLTIISVTFIGGIFSIGGLNLINLQIALKKEKENNKKVTNILPAEYVIEKLGVNMLHSALDHFFIPSKNIFIVYGHEHDAKIYKSDNHFSSFSCIWDYRNNADGKKHFVQTVDYYRDTYIALGDYSSGYVTIMNIDNISSFSFSAINNRIDFLKFSFNGQYLAISSNNDNIKEICIFNILTKTKLNIEGYGPIYWTYEDELLYINNENQITKLNVTKERYEILNINERTNIYSYDKQNIFYISQNFGEENKIKMLEMKTKRPFDLYRGNLEINSLYCHENKLILITSMNSGYAPNSIIIMDYCGIIENKINCQSNYYDFYKTFSIVKYKKNTYITTIGRNLYIPVIKNFTNKYLINLRKYRKDNEFQKSLVSVKLSINKEKLYLSVLDKDGNLEVFHITDSVTS